MRQIEASSSIQIILLLTFGLINFACGLRCWACNGRISVSELKERLKTGANTTECGDPFFDSPNSALDDCETRGSTLHQTWCRKTIQREKDTVIFTRSCDLSHEDLVEYEYVGNRNGRQGNGGLFIPEEHRCNSKAEPNGNFMDDCWCRGRDGCNSFGTELKWALQNSATWSSSDLTTKIFSILVPTLSMLLLF